MRVPARLRVRGVRPRLFLPIAAIVVLGIGTLAYLSHTQANHERADVARERGATAIGALKANVLAQRRSNETYAQLLADDPDVKRATASGDGTALGLALAPRRAKLGAGFVAVVSSGGKAVMQVGAGGEELDGGLVSAASVGLTRSSAVLTVSGLQISAATPIQGASGIAGVLVVGRVLDEVGLMLARQTVGVDLAVFANGALVMTSVESPALRERLAGGLSSVLASDLSQFGVWADAMPLDGGGTAILLVPTTDFGELLTQRGVLLLGAAGILLLTLVAAIGALSRDIVRPLQRLRASAISLQGGDYGQRVPAASIREIDELGETFNELARQQGEQIATIGENARRLQAVLDTSPDLIAILDIDGTFLFGSSAFERVLGLSPERLVGTSVFDLVPADDHARIRARLLELRQGKRSGPMEFRPAVPGHELAYFEANGELLVDQAGTPTGMVVVARETTERRNAEETLRASEALYRSILNSSPDAVAITDMEAQIQMYSPAALTMLGVDSAEGLYGRPITDFVVPDDRDRAYANILRMHERGGERPQRSPDEYRAIRADGSVFEVEVLGDFIRDAGGQPTGMVFDVREITERKEAEAERVRLETTLTQFQKLEAVGHLAGGVAHDFNNMLGVILASADMAMLSLEPSAPAREDLTQIRNAAERSAQLTRQLLAFARKQVITPKYQDLNETVEAMLKMLRRLIGEGTELVWKPRPEPCPVYMDPSQVDQILANLVVNARDATDGVGTVTIATAVAEIDEVGVPAQPNAVPGRYVVLSVEDNGCGMDAQTLGRIFEPFFTTKPVGQGTGLGLATVYGIAQQNHGFVDVKSRLGSGTSFMFYVPLREPRSSNALAPRTAEDSPRGTETILLVEDEKALLSLTARMLVGLGYTLLPADGPARAAQMAAEYESEIDLLVSDMIMPGMNGVELLKRVRAARPGLKCLFVSGYPMDVLAGAESFGPGVDLLQKPFSRDALASKLREVLTGG